MNEELLTMSVPGATIEITVSGDEEAVERVSSEIESALLGSIGQAMTAAVMGDR